MKKKTYQVMFNGKALRTIKAASQHSAEIIAGLIGYSDRAEYPVIEKGGVR